MRATLALALLASALLAGCEKHNPNYDPPAPNPATEKPVANHKFDGGESNPYARPGEDAGGGGEGGGGGGGH